ncbi:MAG TPA: ABC transporter ATP-binding protein [Trebonia sp.]|nr:ABC transporter ATP-binding protein [Trebonia sp.]
MRIARAARYLFSLGLQVDRGRLVRAVVLMFAGYIAAPLAALALRSLTDSLLGRQADRALLYALLAAVLLVAQLMLSHFAHLDYFEVAELQQNRLRGELMSLVNGPSGIDHLDRADFADNTGLVRDGLFGSTRALEAVLQLAGLILQTAITAGILIDLNPFFAFLPVCAVVPVLLERVAQSAVESAREQTAERLRLNKHLIELATGIGSVKELRLFGGEGVLLDRQRSTWDEVTAAMWRSQLKAAVYRAAGQGFFAVGYGGAIVLELASALNRHASIGDLVLVITLAVQVSVQVSGALGLLSLLQTAGRTVERIEELRSIAASAQGRARTGRQALASVPRRLNGGITLEDVSFSYPGSAKPVLSGVCLDIAAGQTLALVGENGAGKSTLVKLLCGLYQPTSGRILADGVDLADVDPEQWRARVAALFQDFTRIELTLGESIGHGDVARIADPSAMETAVSQARAERVLRSVAGGLDGYVGRAYDHGAELSGGQWQTIGLARSLMRRSPLLLVLDEPAAALDASAEHELFERYASSAGRAGQEHGGVTVLVSHRFSTVLMADRIAVLEQGRLAEFGSHRDLMMAGGLYAELFALQARAYG